MALMAKKLGRPDAAEVIVDDSYRLMKRSRQPTVNREPE
jgi:hypothetical protein